MIACPHSYPHGPAEGRTDTSREAAEALLPITARLQRIAYLGLCEAGAKGQTAHELAARTGVDRAAIQPRITELRRLGKVIDSGDRRQNASGKRAIVWRAVAAGEAA